MRTDSTTAAAAPVARMDNLAGGRPARLLEVAFGHVDEDDVERLRDDFAR